MSRHVLFDQLVDYWAGDLDATSADAIEEHLFACASCAAAAEPIARIARILRRTTPVVVTAEQVEDLRARGLAIVENAFVPGRREVVFPRGTDLLVHRLGGLDLSRAERVHVAVRVESSGETLFEEPFAPFDRERGEIRIACQRHFARMPWDVVFDVRAIGPSGAVEASSFVIPHVYDA